jgi:glucose/arabinose dehydrogenase
VIVRRVAIAGLLGLALAGCGDGGGDGSRAPVPTPVPTATPVDSGQVVLEPLVSGLVDPLDLQAPDDGSGRLLVVEQRGRIRVVQDGELVDRAWLDIRDRVRTAPEMGLLGLALHPDFATNGRAFVNYTREQGTQLQSVISEFRASPTNPEVDNDTEEILLVIDQPPHENHKGGQLQFGPDGFLYVAMGDGGGAGGPGALSQNLESLLGKLLRIDVDGARPYVVPPDNPFVGQGTARAEIWAYGFRNPWRFSFDAFTGRLFAGDVGQMTREEVDLVERGGNYGWPITEGSLCYPPPATVCDQTGLLRPIHEYGTSDGQTVIGGHVYRGAEIPLLTGVYVFADFSSGRIWGLREQLNGNWEREDLLQTDLFISALGRDAQGEMYVVDLGGEVYRLRRGPG